MTTVIAVPDKDGVTWGWDSLMVTGNEAREMVNPKVVVNNGLIYGVSGHLRALDVIQYTEFPTYNRELSPDTRKWLITVWVPVAKEAFAEAGLLSEDGLTEGFGLLIGTPTEVFALDSMLSVSHSVRGPLGVGSGGDYAMGAAQAGADVLEALHAAGNLDPFTGGTFFVVRAKEYIDAHPII